VNDEASENKLDASQAQIGVVGDHARIEGGVHYVIYNYNRPEVSPSPAPETDTRPGDEAIPDNPYHGLFAFSPEDARFFFGRETFTQRLVYATDRQALVAVLGASGSGKSSVVFAGLVPALLNQSSDKWLFTTFRPGKDPFFGAGQRSRPPPGT